MKPARRLKGHKDAATCCIASRLRPGLLASSGDDGCICYFDLRCKDVISTISVGEEPISSLCFKGGNEDVIYASSGTKISSFDIHMASSWKPLETYNYNKDEINQITFSSKSNFLAAADDSGDVKICSSVQFLSWKPWTAITGGLDLKLAIWDFSKGRPSHVIDFGVPELNRSSANGNSGQCFNPPLVHSVAVPEADMLPGQKSCAVARGDGVIDVIDLEAELATLKSKGTSKPKGSSSKPKKGDAQAMDQQQRKHVQLDYSVGGHTAGVSCLCFSIFSEPGKFLLSGGNDAAVKVWDWSKCLDHENTNSSNYLCLTIDTNKKVNWLCSTQTGSENSIIVCDTSKVLKVYTIP